VVASSRDTFQQLETGDFDTVVLDPLARETTTAGVCSRTSRPSQVSRTCLWWSTPEDLFEEGGDAPQEIRPSPSSSRAGPARRRSCSATLRFSCTGSRRSFPAEAERDPAQQGEEGEKMNGKKVLIVDDDVRNIFAVTSVLETHGLE